MPSCTASRIADDRRCFLGESPRWDPERSRVVWIDVLAGRILSRSVDGSEGDSLTIGGRVGGLVLRTGGRGFVIGQERAIVLTGPDGRPEGELFDPVPGAGPALRTNELAVDPEGRLVFGTMAGNKQEGASALWRLERSGELLPLREGLTVSNGMGWSPDASTLYHVASSRREVDRLPYGPDGCGPPEVVVKIEEGAGVPDGLCVDSEGGFWVAINGGGQCRHYDPDGTETDRVEVGAAAVSSCVLVAGADGPQLYMTTAASGMEEEDLLQQPGAGFLFVAPVNSPPAPPPLCPF